MTSNILDLKLAPNDANAGTVREYLVALLHQLWTREDGFSGKRPFGNSGWQYEVYDAIEQAGIEGDPEQLVLAAIRALGQA